MIRRRSFSTRLSLNILLVVSILFLAAIGILAFTSHKLITEEAKRSAQAVLNASISDIEKKLQPTQSKTQSAAWFVANQDCDTATLRFLTTAVIKDLEIIGSGVAYAPFAYDTACYYFMYYTSDINNELKSKVLGSDEYNYFSMDWFRIPYETKKPYWSDPYFDKGGGDCLMATYSYPLTGKDGKVYAVVTADITLEWIADKIMSIKPYEHSYFTVVSANGSYFDVITEEGLKNETIYTTSERAANKQVTKITKEMMAGHSGVEQYSSHGNVGFAVYGPLHNGWSAAIVCQYRDVLERSLEMSKILALVCLFGLIAMFIICRRTVRKLTQPITELTVSAMNMAKGNFHAQLSDVDTNDEMRRLHDSFEYMQHSLNDYISELKTTTASNERFESELNIAKSIQQHMVPTDFPKRNDVDLFALLQPAREVGGDLYDFVIRGDELYFTIGDVSGKGVPAAMFMSITRTISRFISGLDIELDEVMGKINDSVVDGNDSGMFVTLFMGSLNLKTGHLKYCNGGHNPLVVIPANGKEPYFLSQKPNIAVGVWPDFKFEMQETDLAEGTRLLLYTDGVSEAERHDKSQYGNDRLLEWAKTSLKNDKEEAVCKSLLENVQAFTDGNEQNDDITIMSVKLK